MKRALAIPIAEALVETLSCACLRLEVKGSLSRKKADVGDIELVAIPTYEVTGQASLFDGPEQMRNLLHGRISDLGEDRLLPITTRAKRLPDGRWQLAGEPLSSSEPIADRLWRTKALTDSRYFKLWLPRKRIVLDLFMATAETWGAIATIRTGSADFSQRLVAKWTEKSGGGHVHRGRFHLPWKNGELVVDRTASGVPLGAAVDTPEERDVFHVLGLGWVEPHDRS